MKKGAITAVTGLIIALVALTIVLGLLASAKYIIEDKTSQTKDLFKLEKIITGVKEINAECPNEGLKIKLVDFKAKHKQGKSLYMAIMGSMLIEGQFKSFITDPEPEIILPIKKTNITLETDITNFALPVNDEEKGIITLSFWDDTVENSCIRNFFEGGVDNYKEAAFHDVSSSCPHSFLGSKTFTVDKIKESCRTYEGDMPHGEIIGLRHEITENSLSDDEIDIFASVKNNGGHMLCYDMIVYSVEGNREEIDSEVSCLDPSEIETIKVSSREEPSMHPLLDILPGDTSWSLSNVQNGYMIRLKDSSNYRILDTLCVGGDDISYSENPKRFGDLNSLRDSCPEFGGENCKGKINTVSHNTYPSASSLQNDVNEIDVDVDVKNTGTQTCYFKTEVRFPYPHYGSSIDSSCESNLEPGESKDCHFTTSDQGSSPGFEVSDLEGGYKVILTARKEGDPGNDFTEIDTDKRNLELGVEGVILEDVYWAEDENGNTKIDNGGDVLIGEPVYMVSKFSSLTPSFGSVKFRLYRDAFGGDIRFSGSKESTTNTPDKRIGGFYFTQPIEDIYFTVSKNDFSWDTDSNQNQINAIKPNTQTDWEKNGASVSSISLGEKVNLIATLDGISSDWHGDVDFYIYEDTTGPFNEFKSAQDTTRIDGTNKFYFEKTFDESGHYYFEVKLFNTKLDTSSNLVVNNN